MSRFNNPDSKRNIYNCIVPKMTELFIDINNQKPFGMTNEDTKKYYKETGESLKKIFSQLIDSECKMFTDINCNGEVNAENETE